MIINQEGMRYTYNGMTYTVGAAVMATEASEYRGLYGTITEIRDGSDRETENDTPDIYWITLSCAMPGSTSCSSGSQERSSFRTSCRFFPSQFTVLPIIK